jgi:hypothetical protein
MYTNMKKLSSKGAQFVPIGMFVVCRKRNRQAQHMCCYSKSTTFWRHPTYRSSWTIIILLMVDFVLLLVLTRREPPTMGKQLVNFITCGCASSAPYFVTYKAWREPTPYWLLSLIAHMYLQPKFIYWNVSWAWNSHITWKSYK